MVALAESEAPTGTFSMATAWVSPAVKFTGKSVPFIVTITL